MSNPEQPRILIMEDDGGMRRLFQKKLERSGYTVDLAPDGEEGLKKLDETGYAVVVIDYNMPGKDGLQVIREMGERGTLPTTIMLTGNSNADVAVEAMKLGARDYVIKSTDASYLDLMPTVIERARRLHEAEENVRLSAKVFDSTQEGILITDAQSAIVSVNRAFTEITGYSSEEVVGKEPGFLHSDRHNAAFYQKLWAALNESGQWRGEIWNRRKNGDVYPEWLTISSVKNDTNQITNYVGVFTDITSRKENEERLRHLATHDPLTNLPNRELWQDRIQQGLAHAKRNNEILAVMLLDLDHFKEVNDTFGHAIGDLMLQSVAQRIRQCMRESDTLARLGGDEFTGIFPNVIDQKHATIIIERIRSELSKALKLGENEFTVTASIGISLFPQDGESASSLLRKADSAMYLAKETRNAFQFA